MRWKDYFNAKVLKEGLDCYVNNAAALVYMEGDSCHARIDDSGIMYKVRIDHPGKNNMETYCNCESALEGFRCRHMAAAMYKWEELYGSGPEEEKEVKVKTFFDMKKLMSKFTIREDRRREALKLIRDGRITLDSFETFQGFYYGTSTSDIFANVKGSYIDGNKKYRLKITLNRSEIRIFECDRCRNDFYGYYRASALPCEHVIGLMLLAKKYITEYDPGDYTDYMAERFFRAFKTENSPGSASGSVVLEPRLVEGNTGIEVNFRIGNGGKLYVVKNLTTLYDTVRKRGKYELGKNSRIDFSFETFNEDSSKLYSLIEREVQRGIAIERKMEARSSYHNSGTLETGKGIPFTGETVDIIYEMNSGSTIEYKTVDKNKAVTLSVSDCGPTVDIAIDPGYEKKEIVGVWVSGKAPRIVNGTGTHYFISEDHLSRIDDESYAMVKPFSEQLSMEDRKFKFFIGRKRAAEFYYGVLPKIRESRIFNVQENVSAESIAKKKAEFSFYLDIEGEWILCRTKAAYGDEEFTIRNIENENLPLPYERDMNQEIPVRELLGSMFETYSVEKDAFAVYDDIDTHYEFLKTGVERLLEYGEVHSTDNFSRIRIRKTPLIQLGVALDSNLLDLTIKSTDIELEELADILKSYKEKKKYHRLRNGEYVELEEGDSLYSLMETLEASGTSVKEFTKGKLQIPVYRALYLEKMLEEHDDMVAERDKNYRKLIRDFKTISDADYEIPEGLTDILRPYQQHGYKWLKTLENAGFGGILADDMGLGKTLQVITMVMACEKRRALVVCPASLVYNWIDEIHRFAPGLTAAAVTGTKGNRRQILAEYENYDFIITSYDLLKRDIDMYDELEFTHQIIDEAQYIKNAGSVAAKSVKLIHASHKFALTGTPIENRLSELWSIYDYLMPGFLYGYDRFRKDYEVPISKRKDERQTAALHNMIAPFILRRKKKDVLKELPDKVEEVYAAGFESEQQKLYDAQVSKLKGLINSKNEDFDKSKIQILAEITKVRQICCDPSLIFEDYKGESAKRKACLELLDSAIEGGHKVLLFSQFTSMLSLLEEDLKAAGIGYYMLTGATPKEERVKLVKAFNEDDTPVFLISLKAGGTGLNLTGADIVVHYDPWWNKAAQDQATDRAHRIGQTQKVTVYQLIAKDTIEERIIELQQQKKEIADAVLAGESRSIGSMSKEELLELLGV